MERNIYLVNNDPLNPQKAVRVKAVVKDFHAEAGVNFKPELILKQGCVSCHGGRAKGKTGEELYAAVCAPCHRPGGSATKLDAAYLAAHPAGSLRSKIAKGHGKIPGFAVAHGGPLSDRQIDSLISSLASRSTGVANSPK